MTSTRGQYEYKEYAKSNSAFEEYLAMYGEHFSKKLCEWAVSNMEVEERLQNGERKKKKLDPWDKKKTEEVLEKYGITLKNDKGYDKVFVINMGRADYYGKSVPGEVQLAMYVRDVLDDPDGYDGIAFCRFMMDCIGRGIPIIWEDML